MLWNEHIFANSKYCLCPFHMNEGLLSEHKLYIKQNKLMYSTGAFGSAHILQIIRSSYQHCALVCLFFGLFWCIVANQYVACAAASAMCNIAFFFRNFRQVVDYKTFLACNLFWKSNKIGS